MNRRAREKCREKVRHADFQGAVTALKRVGNKGLDAYRCPYCKGWHLGRSRSAHKRVSRLDQLFEEIARLRNCDGTIGEDGRHEISAVKHISENKEAVPAALHADGNEPESNAPPRKGRLPCTPS